MSSLLSPLLRGEFTGACRIVPGPSPSSGDFVYVALCVSQLLTWKTWMIMMIIPPERHVVSDDKIKKTPEGL